MTDRLEPTTERLDVRKTYKLFINGEFPRSESGRIYQAGSVNAPQASRKDVRDAVAAARAAQEKWAARTAYNRAQILYRIAEMLEGRRDQFVAELARSGAADPGTEVDMAIDRWVWYAGWADKVAQMAGGANPVAGPYFNLSVPEPSGVVSVVVPDEPALLGLVSRVAPAVVSGNTVVVLASERAPLPALSFAEVLATSDLPAGVINVLSGYQAELTPWLAGHRDVNVVDLAGVNDEELRTAARREAADAVARVIQRPSAAHDWFGVNSQSLDLIVASCEIKTVWHPKGR